GLDQLVLGLGAIALTALLQQPGVGIGGLGILVQPLHVGVGRRGVEVEVILLDVFAVVALVAGQAEQALLEDRVLLVPERQREAQALMVVRDAGQAVLAPAIGPRPRMLVGEELPRGAVGAVVLPHRPPLSLAQEGTPAAPVGAALLSLFQTLLFRLHAFRVPRRPHAVEAVPESLRRAATPSQPPVNSLTPPTRCQIVGALVRAAYPTARRPEGLVVSIRRLPVAVAGSDAPGH